MKRRLDKLEGSLSPKQAVLHWLGEAHTHGSLPAYVETLIDEPEGTQPFVALPRNVADAVWRRMRGEPKAAIKTAMDEAIADTVFLLRLVLGLNVHIEEMLRVESLRHAALYWWSRALDPDRRTKANLPPEWHAGVAGLVGTTRGTDDALRAAQARYLDGHEVLLADLATAWKELLAAVEVLDRDGHDDPRVRASAARWVKQVVGMARADGLDAISRWAEGDDIARRVVRSEDDHARPQDRAGPPGQR